MLGILMPLVICLCLYVAIFIYVAYLTNKYYAIDLKHWKTSQLNQINQRYANQIKVIDQEIRQLGGTD